MMPGVNPKQMAQAMRAMGIKTSEIDAKEVIIKTGSKELVISNPKVTQIDMKGVKTFQVMGDVEEREALSYDDGDVAMVMEQAHVSEGQAKEALEKHGGDLAEAILELQG